MNCSGLVEVLGKAAQHKCLQMRLELRCNHVPHSWVVRWQGAIAEFKVQVYVPVSATQMRPTPT